MGMARVPTLARPFVGKRGGMWRVMWCDILTNNLVYRDFYTWYEAIAWAT